MVISIFIDTGGGALYTLIKISILKTPHQSDAAVWTTGFHCFTGFGGRKTKAGVFLAPDNEGGPKQTWSDPTFSFSL